MHPNVAEHRGGARLWAFAVMGLMWLSSGLVHAHHGWSHYDSNEPLSLTGVIRQASYANPHGTLELSVTGQDREAWHIVLAPPTRMTARGLSEEMLTPGATATVVGYPHRQNRGELRAERITVGGRTVELR